MDTATGILQLQKDKKDEEVVTIAVPTIKQPKVPEGRVETTEGRGLGMVNIAAHVNVTVGRTPGAGHLGSNPLRLSLLSLPSGSRELGWAPFMGPRGAPARVAAPAEGGCGSWSSLAWPLGTQHAHVHAGLQTPWHATAASRLQLGCDLSFCRGLRQQKPERK